MRLPQGIEKFNTAGEPEDVCNDFSEAGNLTLRFRVTDITGVPGAKYLAKKCRGTPRAVLPWTLSGRYLCGGFERVIQRRRVLNRGQAVVEFSPSGEFVRAFTGAGNPRSRRRPSPTTASVVRSRGVAVDPVSWSSARLGVNGRGPKDEEMGKWRRLMNLLPMGPKWAVCRARSPRATLVVPSGVSCAVTVDANRLKCVSSKQRGWCERSGRG